MFFGMTLALFPALSQDYGGASVLGLMYAAPAVGAAIAALASGWTRRVLRRGRAGGGGRARGDPIRPARRTMFDLIHRPKVARQQ
jgi:hypothetical protein